MDKSTWFYLLLAGLSIVYNFYKKQKKRQNENAQPAPKPAQQNQKSVWDIDSLVSEFQKEYGVEPVSEVEPIQEVQESRYTDNFIDENETQEQGFVKPEESYSRKEYVDVDDHTDMDAQKQKSAAFNAKNFKKEEEKSMPEIDLRQMIIHSTILNRPDY